MPHCIELCSGGGVASIGIHEAGFTSVGFDYCEKASRTASNNGHTSVQLDLTRDDALDIIRAHSDHPQMVWASPPCQGYSLASNACSARKSARNSVTRACCDLIHRIGPPVFVIENVQSARRHPEFVEAVGVLKQQYHTVEVTLDAAKIPAARVCQRRKRVFVVGCRTCALRGVETIATMRAFVDECAAMMQSDYATAMSDVIPELVGKRVFMYPRLTRSACVFDASGPSPTIRSVCLAHPSPAIRDVNPGIADAVLPDIALVAKICGVPATYAFLNERVATSLILGNCVPPPVAKYVSEFARTLIPFAGNGMTRGFHQKGDYRIKPVKCIQFQLANLD